MLVLTDAAGVITTALGGALHAFGLVGQQLVGQPFATVFAPWPELVDGLRRALRGERHRVTVVADSSRLTFGLEERRGEPERLGVIVFAAVSGPELADAATRQLAESEQRLAAAQQLAHVGSWEWSVADDRVTWSEELYHIYGLERSAFGGRSADFFERILPEDAEEVRRIIEVAQASAGPFAFEYRIRRPDGTLRVLRSQGDVLVGEGGRPVRLVGSCWDVTERWQTTRELERSLSLLRATLEATADGLLVVDRQGKVVVANERFRAMWDIPETLLRRGKDEELLAAVSEQLADPPSFLRQVQALYERPEAESFDVLRFANGRVFERYSRPQRLGDEVIGRVWSFRDVSERDRSLRRAVFLADASRLLGSLELDEALEALAKLAIPFLGDGCAICVAAQGLPRLDIRKGEGLENIATPPACEVSASIFAAGRRWQMIAPIEVRGQTVGSLAVSTARSRYTADELGFLERLAERVAQALERAQLLAETRRALRARDEFLAVAAHEIRGPLAAIHLAAQGLREEALPEAQRDAVLAIIEREDRRLARFVGNLLDLGRAQTGELQLELQPMDLAQLAREVLEDLRRELLPGASELRLDAPAPVIGEWDRARLEQVITNLVTNAVKFGRGQPVEVRVRAAAGNATLEVEDHGIGIPQDRLEHIFAPFERAVSGREYAGLGLGLYIVDNIVRGLGGSIRVDSIEGQGSTFIVTLPPLRPAP